MPKLGNSDCIFVTGGAGFIGSAVIRELIRSTEAKVVNVDCLTYAGNLATVAEVADSPKYHFAEVDIRNAEAVGDLFGQYRPRAVMHLAAESHVDRSIDGPGSFISTNVVGTYTLLEAVRDYVNNENSSGCECRFHHVSTDEVYGSLGPQGFFTEYSPYAPNSPYSASKAASDHLVRAWHQTFELDVVVSNCSNNYGPYQYPEKLIPVIIQKALAEAPIPIYGCGENVRDWLFVEDHARALVKIMQAGAPGQTYNVGGNAEKTNLEVVQSVCGILDSIRPRPSGQPYAQLIEFVTDRPGHDLRYAIDASRIRRDLGWQAVETFESGLTTTINWYLENATWVSTVTGGDSIGQRLGLGGAQ